MHQLTFPPALEGKFITPNEQFTRHSMAKLKIEGLTKGFDDGDIIAVEDLNLEINDGEFVVIVGPSGCGKSTTLNTIAGLEKPTTGSLYIGDNEITDLPPQERDTAMVFQNYALYPHMDVASNIGFGLKMSTDMSEADRQERVEDAAEFLQITELLDQRPAELSGGQQQRVALGRAIVREPAVFLMDEPLSNLDAKLRSDMRTEIQRLHNSLEVTTVYVTHDQTEAMTMSDRIAVLDGGRLQQFATPQEVYHKPANRFVASFIGEPSMNFFDVYREPKDGDQIQFEGLDVTCEMPTLSQRLADSPRDLVLGVRPDHIELTDDYDFRAEVQVVEPMGEYNLAHIDLNDRSYTVKLDGKQTPDELAVSGFAIPEDRIYLFDRGSGEALLHPLREKLPA